LPTGILQTITGPRRAEVSSGQLQGSSYLREEPVSRIGVHLQTCPDPGGAYNSLLIKRRKEIHERIGKAIEDIYADRLEEFYEILAHHYFTAEDREKAFQYLRLAAEKPIVATLPESLWVLPRRSEHPRQCPTRM